MIEALLTVAAPKAWRKRKIEEQQGGVANA